MRGEAVVLLWLWSPSLTLGIAEEQTVAGSPVDPPKMDGTTWTVHINYRLLSGGHHLDRTRNYRLPNRRFAKIII